MMAIAIVAEDSLGEAVVQRFVDRKLAGGVSGIDGGNIEWFRRFVTGDEVGSWRCKSLGARLKTPQGWGRGRVPSVTLGHFGGEPGGLDARMHRRFFHFFQTEPVWDEDDRERVLVIARDEDKVGAERHEGFKQAYSHFKKAYPEADRRFAVILALAKPEIESWALAGYEIENDDEKTKLKGIRKDLGFDPTLKGERLTARNPKEDTKDAKRVFEVLTAGDSGRADRCLDADFSRLRERGKEIGLANFLDQLEVKVVHKLAGGRPPSRGPS